MVFLAISAPWSSISLAVELSIAAIKARAGESVVVPLKVDKVHGLAGVKLVMKYDPKILVFRKGDKTKHTTSFMHIVNDKKPGLLIAVMASAKGIGGENIPILTLTFGVKAGLKGNLSTALEITELQLMNDSLKDIKTTIKIDPIAISTQQGISALPQDLN